MKKSILVVAAITAVFSATAFAGIIPPPVTTYPATSTSKTETRGYVGLNWTLGGSYTPAVVLGVTNTKVKSNDETTGAKLAFHINLLGGISPGMLKLSYLKGREDLQGEFGAGYNFIKSAPLIAWGVNVPYVAVGVDAYMNPGLVPYATLHSQGKFSQPAATCNPGDTLITSATCRQVPN